MREIWAKVRYLFRRESHLRELGEEIDAHLEIPDLCQGVKATG